MSLPAPPRAEPRAYSYERHGRQVDDPWHWLRDPGYPEVTDAAVVDYLKAENAFFDAAMAPHKKLVETLFEEMKGRIKEDESSVPVRDGDWLYWWAFRPGAQYRSWYRQRVEGGPDELILDEPAEAEGKDYYRLGALAVSPDGRLAATLVDDKGAERFELRIRDLASGEVIETVTEVGIGQPVWSADSRFILYTEVNEHWRSYRARLHRLGRPPAEARTIYEETEDLGFSVGLSRSQDRSLIFVSSGDNSSNEIRFLAAADPEAEPVLISRRQARRQYMADASHGKLWLLANDEHVNFRLAEADPARPGEWTNVIPGSDRVYLTGLSAYRDHLALSARIDGLDQLLLRTYAGEESRIPFPEAAYAAGFSGNPEYAPAAYRLHYSSMVTPATVYDYRPGEDGLETLKVQEIPSGYDGSRYETERLMVPARDGERIPVSVVYPKGFPRDGSGKLFLYAYGAYGIAIEPAFSTSRISLLDRGWAYAIAHIRGGDDMGYGWFLDGKLEKRWNSFHDFVDAAKGLIAAGFSAPGRIAIQGGSAGGGGAGGAPPTKPEMGGAGGGGGPLPPQVPKD